MFAFLACAPPEGGESADSAAPAEEPTGPCAALHVEPVATWDEEEVPITAQTGTTWPGVAVGDVTGDGRPDLVGAFPGGTVLFRNEADGWAAAPLPLGGDAARAVRAVALADLDGDGDLDGFFGGELGLPSWIGTNDGAGNFSVQEIAGYTHRVWTGAFGDFDGDGRVDLFTATYDAELDLDAILAGARGAGQALVVQTDTGWALAEGAVPAVTGEALSLQGAPVDFDADGDLDVYLANDFGPYAVPNRMLVNDGAGRFSVGEGLGCELSVYAMGAGVGDADGDGSPDLFVTDVGPPHLLLNDGAGGYADATLATGAHVAPTATNMTSWGAVFADLDQDTWDDVLVAYGGLGDAVDVAALENADPTWTDDKLQHSLLLRNTEGSFARDDTAFTDLARARGVIVADLTLDGRPDVVTFGKVFLHVFETTGGCEPGVTVRLRGPVGNAHGFGARVDAVVGGRRSTRWMLPSSTAGQSALEVYVGSANHPTVDLEVTWPDGGVVLVPDVPAGAVVDVEPP